MLSVQVRNSRHELVRCIEMFTQQYDDTEYFPNDKSYFVNNMTRVLSNGGQLVLIHDDGELVAAGCMQVATPHLHCSEKEVSQVYYRSLLTGVKAVKALVMFHETMIDYANHLNIRKCVSTSMMQNQEVFYRILEKEGWVRRGVLMVYLLRSADAPGQRTLAGGRILAQNASALPRSPRVNTRGSLAPCVSPEAALQVLEPDKLKKD